MTQQPSDNLISAYLDGELSPREHEQFEKTLAPSSELQEELRDYERLRTILRNLPQETISDEFTSSVLQQAERVSLLPMNHDSNQRDVKPASGSSRNTMVVAGSLVATAAALFLMIRLMVMPGQTPSSNSPTAGKSTPQNSIAKLESNERNRPGFSSPKASGTPEMLGGGSPGQPERGKALVADKSTESLKFGQPKGRRRAFKTTTAAPSKKPMK